MLKSKLLNVNSALLAGIGLFIFIVANLSTAVASESGCVTCHTDQDMLKKTVAAQKGKKSAMQSGAG